MRAGMNLRRTMSRTEYCARQAGEESTSEGTLDFAGMVTYVKMRVYERMSELQGVNRYVDQPSGLENSLG